MDKIDISDPKALIPGIQLRAHKEREDFALEAYNDSSFPVGGGESPTIKDKADKGVWAIITLWQKTYLRIRKIPYVIPSDSKKYELYNKVAKLVEGFGYDGVRSLAKAYWTLPRWQNYERTIERFASHAQSVYESLQRNRSRE